ncbi:MAG: ABC transporter ATP-binding protein, partial [Syntrophomonadaceae bacterium]|nr:ABC transporter ATP-binding protein [Syntrophomonadaceae bacterium]
MALYKIKDLTYYYPHSAHPALNRVSLNLEEGEFVLLLGSSGGGKSSLLRLLGGLIPDFYGGRIAGDALFRGRKLSEWTKPALVQEVGFVFQDPEKQLILRNVEREIAFGLENLGITRIEMRRRVAEVMDFFGLDELSRKESTQELSGGEKQKLTLAAVLAMQPRVLLLDEPTSQLDPAAAEEILNLVKRLNEEMGITVVLVEQRLERCYHLADRVVLMDGGNIAADGDPQKIISWQAERLSPLMPPVARFFAHLGQPEIPLTVKQGQQRFRQMGLLDAEGVSANCSPALYPAHPGPYKAEKAADFGAVNVKNVWFLYDNGQ